MFSCLCRPRAKSPSNCDVQLVESLFQTRSRACFVCAQLVCLNKNFEKAKNIFRFPIEIYMGMCYIICIKYPKKC
ncbi:MAG: DUF6783 domain-containing protein [Ruminococcus sp.]